MKQNTMTVKDLEDFLDFAGLTNEEFAELLGVTKPAVDHWLTGRRSVPATTVKLIRFFRLNPQAMKEF